MTLTCRVRLSTLAVLLPLIFSFPQSLITTQLQMEKHINMCAQNVLDGFQLALDVPGSADLVTQHISYLNKFNMALSGISVRANCAEDNVSNNRLNPISQAHPLEVQFR